MREDVKNMSWWTYINGTITVEPAGRTQAEKRYILDTVLNHLPQVTSSEKNMNVYVIQKYGTNESSSCNEFGEFLSYQNWMEIQSQYILTIDGSLRNRMFSQVYKEFQKWICRLSKRVMVVDILVRINDDYDKSIIQNYEPYYYMFEPPLWIDENQNGEPAWYEYLMWERMDNCGYPRLLGYKYFNDEKNDEKVRNWLNLKDKCNFCVR